MPKHAPKASITKHSHNAPIWRYIGSAEPKRLKGLEFTDLFLNDIFLIFFIKVPAVFIKGNES